MPDAQIKQLLFNACSNDDYKTFRENLITEGINAALDDLGNTALHIATREGHEDIVELLLRRHASRSVVNNEGKLPIQVTFNDTILKLYQAEYRPLPDAKDHYVGDQQELEPIEWLDSYRNAYRISYENHEHMKRWITKVPLKKLLEEIRDNYIKTITFPSEATREKAKNQIQKAIDENDLLQLVKLYTGAAKFCTYLNTDLAKVGSDFRFISTRLDYPDNEPPKDLGQYVYTSLLVNHTVFQKYRCALTTFRGMTVTKEDLSVYTKGKIVITRSFLSTSEAREMAEEFLGFNDIDNRPPVICIYTVSNPRSSLCIKTLSRFPKEQEVLIVPFIAFEITAVEDDKITKEGIDYPLKRIELRECVSNIK